MSNRLMPMIELIDRLASLWLMWSTNWHMKRNPELVNRFQMETVKADPKNLEITLLAPDIVFLANEAAALLNAKHAKNYFQFDMVPRIDKATRPIRVTVQWMDGMSPAEKNAMLEKRIAELENK